MVLGFYTLPTLFSAYVYGRKHAVLTAVGSVLLVVVVSIANPAQFTHSAETEWDKWFDLGVWAGLLTIMAYAMGTLYERKEVHLRELSRQTGSCATANLKEWLLISNWETWAAAAEKVAHSNIPCPCDFLRHRGKRS